MAEAKTVPSGASVTAFLEGIADEQKRQDSFVVLELMRRVTGTEPAMWGSSIIGFGHRHYKYASGHEGDTFILGLSPRKDALTLYLPTYLERHAEALERLGKYKTGKGCLYIKRLSDVDLSALEALLLETAAQVMR